MTREEVHLTVAIDFLCDECFEEFKVRCADSFGLEVYHGHIGKALMIELMEEERAEVYRQVMRRIEDCCWHKP